MTNRIVELYRDKQKQHRWRLKATNGRLMADCGEGYRRRIDCWRAALKLFPKTRVVVCE